MEDVKRVSGLETKLKPNLRCTMTGKALKTFSTAVMERITGEGPGRARAVAASVIAGVAAGGVTYRLLRGNAD
jgi:hypothetical protein